MLEYTCTLCGERWWRFAMITDTPFVCHACDFKRARKVFDTDITQPLLLYVAGKYRGDVKKNINEASKVGATLWGMGHHVITPHMNTAFMEKYSHASTEQFLAGDLRMLSHCDGIVLLPGWQESEGARGEYALALKKGLLVWEWPSCPPPPENVSGD